MELEAELRAAIEDAVVGENLSPQLAGRARAAARAVLLRRGLGAARVEARTGRGGVEITVTLPPGPARVREIRLHLAGR